MSAKPIKLTCLLASLLMCGSAAAVTYSDNFSSKSASLQWTALNDACLTAGSGVGSIPACGTSMISTPDADGSGALRLTPATTYQTGAILSNFTFPSNQGMQVTFTTYTYGGSKDGTAKNGADGIAFLLTDGTAAAPTVAGGSGGSMGYSCSNGNGNFQGLANAYLGLGIDEFGNFLNSGDNTSSGVYNSNSLLYTGGTTYGSNAWSNSPNGSIAGGSGAQYQPERIGLRGAGNTTWAWLSSQNPTYYPPGTPDTGKTQAACKSGQYVFQGNSTASKNMKALPYNYAVIAGGYKILPDGTTTDSNGNTIAAQPIASNNATSHNDSKAWPITYKLVLSSSGLLNFSYSYNNGAFQPVLVNSNITASNGTVPSLFRFGFSAGTGGSSNVHEITCFQASPLQSNSSAAANTVQSGQVQTSTQIYLASYSSDNWWGSLTANALATTGGVVSISNIANWDAKCVLTGGPCTSMGTDSSGNAKNTIAVEAPSSRVLLTADSSSSAGISFQWASLNSAQQKTLNSNGTDSLGSTRIDWFRGVRSTEQLQSPVAGQLRARTGVLGDIINSSPVWVGAPAGGNNPDAFSDFLYGSPSTAPENQTGVTAYSSFVSTYGARQNVVYVGGNDGFMHGFRAGLYNSSGYDTTTNDGKEIIGFMPQGQLTKYAVDIASPTYVHDYAVDATPAVGDLFYNKTWHTWLVSGVGSGGSEIFALDVTDPSTFQESNASSLVIGDWTAAQLSHLGNTVGTPLITRMHNNKWAIIFGNGMGSTTSAGVYIGIVDPASTTGAVTFQFVDTGVGSSTLANGISYVSSVDLDGDHIADYLYAGDLQGNVWRIDVTSSDSTKWKLRSTPIFVAKVGSVVQPITTAVTVASVQTGGVNRVMVFFGTGQKTPFNATSGDVFVKGTQTFYGIWDWDMTNWNSLSTIDYASLPTTTAAFDRTKLLSQSVVSTSTTGNGAQVLGYRTLATGTQVCWQGSSTCTPTNTQFGWYFDFPDAQEQVIYNPVMVNGAVVVSSAEPPVISAQKCTAGLQTGWTMAFDPASGGGLQQSFFPSAGGSFAASGGASTAGIQLNAVGSPSTVTYGGQTYLVTQTVTGSAALSQVNPPGGNTSQRVSWREVKL